MKRGVLVTFVRYMRHAYRRRQKLFIVIVASCLLMIVVLAWRGLSTSPDKSTASKELRRLNSTYKCGIDIEQLPMKKNSLPPPPSNVSRAILIVANEESSSLIMTLRHIFNSLRQDVIIENIHDRKSSLYTSDPNVGKYQLVVFEDLFGYLDLPQEARKALDEYCRRFDVGQVLFTNNNDKMSYARARLKDFPLVLLPNQKVADAQLYSRSSVLRLSRTGQIRIGVAPQQYVLFDPQHGTYEALITVRSLQTRHVVDVLQSGRYAATLYDKGVFDGIRRALFGISLSDFIAKLVLLDSIAYLTGGRIDIGLERYLQIDIDDVFLGAKGTRLKSDDVTALLTAQERIRSTVPNFTFQLGFSGKYFSNGNEEEVRAEHKLISLHKHFSWFPHLWNHYKAHNCSEKRLRAFETQHRQFAKAYNLSVGEYAVAPHHSGVYPVHEPLYSVWRDVWNITVTSTEEYPHLRPASLRRGFVHGEIKVLPRQTCGLFTKNILYDEYPGGGAALDAIIEGGELFDTFLLNKYLIFMTHQPNYTKDRLAQYTFERVLQFLQCWTNLKLRAVQPQTMAQLYFEQHPEERLPLWTDPCVDSRHKVIWSPDKQCGRLPAFIIVGPQKTGTTALHNFLSAHPRLRPSKPSTHTFEEVQFFGNERNYANGVDWYMSFFESGDSQTFQYEKSATYFTAKRAPLQIKTLLPNAQIIAILIDPIQRAYSWYQHQRAHNDTTSLKYTFTELLYDNNTDPAAKTLRRHCLEPGHYAEHLERWRKHFSDSQILLIDGHRLRETPVAIMSEVQHFLQVEPIDYTQLLRYDENKGFYCLNTRCLGPSKGRRYAQLDDVTRRRLARYYQEYNTRLLRLFAELKLEPPFWLSDLLRLAALPDV